MNIDKSTAENDDDSWWTLCDGERRVKPTSAKREREPRQAKSGKTLYHNRNHETVLISKNGRPVGCANLEEVFNAKKLPNGLAVISGHAVPYAEVEKVKSCANAQQVMRDMRDRNDRNHALATIHKNCFYC